MRAVAPQLAALSGSAIAGFQPTNGEPDVGPLLTDLMSSHGLTVLIPGQRLVGAWSGSRPTVQRSTGNAPGSHGRVGRWSLSVGTWLTGWA